MIEPTNEPPTVVCICGTLAAGKSTLIRNVIEHIPGSAVLMFDEYAATCEWPHDVSQWIEHGCDPGAVSNPRLREDLQSLLAGSAIRHPIDEHIIEPSPIILLEDPFGRTRPDNADLIDLVLFVDLPWDLSVARMVQRALGLEDLSSRFELNNVPKDEVVARIDSARTWLSAYVARREMYTSLSEPVRATADVVLSGMAPALDVLERTLAVISERTGNELI